MSRAFDVIGIAAVAVVLLLPKASLDAKPALAGEKIELDRIAALEDALYAQHDSPAEVDRAVELADAYLRLLHPDWTLSVTARFADLGDPRVHLLRATAHAERLEPAATIAEAKRGLAACDRTPACGDPTRIKLAMISSAMQALVDANVDPRKDPQKAREAVSKVLHSTSTRPLVAPKKPAP